MKKITEIVQAKFPAIQDVDIWIYDCDSEIMYHATKACIVDNDAIQVAYTQMFSIGDEEVSEVPESNQYINIGYFDHHLICGDSLDECVMDKIAADYKEKDEIKEKANECEKSLCNGFKLFYSLENEKQKEVSSILFIKQSILVDDFFREYKSTCNDVDYEILYRSMQNILRSGLISVVDGACAVKTTIRINDIVSVSIDRNHVDTIKINTSSSNEYNLNRKKYPYEYKIITDLFCSFL